MADRDIVNNIHSINDLNEMTVSELRSLCKSYELARYSKATKPALIDMIMNYYREKLSELTATDLRKIGAENFGLTGLSKLPKNRLIDMIINATNSNIQESTEDEIDLTSSSISMDTDEITSDDSSDDLITVIYGAKERTIEPQKQSVWDIHAELASQMGLPQKPDFQVNGAEVNNNYIPVGGDVIEFFRVNSGSKG